MNNIFSLIGISAIDFVDLSAAFTLAMVSFFWAEEAPLDCRSFNRNCSTQGPDHYICAARPRGPFLCGRNADIDASGSQLGLAQEEGLKQDLSPVRTLTNA